TATPTQYVRPRTTGAHESTARADWATARTGTRRVDSPDRRRDSEGVNRRYRLSVSFASSSARFRRELGQARGHRVSDGRLLYSHCVRLKLTWPLCLYRKQKCATRCAQ